MVKSAFWRIMLCFDMLNKSSPSGESFVVSGAFPNGTAMWATTLVYGHEVCLKIFNRIEKCVDRTSINIASAGLNNVHKIGMPSSDVIIKFVFPRKSE